MLLRRNGSPYAAAQEVGKSGAGVERRGVHEMRFHKTGAFEYCVTSVKNPRSSATAVTCLVNHDNALQRKNDLQLEQGVLLHPPFHRAIVARKQ